MWIGHRSEKLGPETFLVVGDLRGVGSGGEKAQYVMERQAHQHGARDYIQRDVGPLCGGCVKPGRHRHG